MQQSYMRRFLLHVLPGRLSIRIRHYGLLA
jgi:hypothetical protein